MNEEKKRKRIPAGFYDFWEVMDRAGCGVAKKDRAANNNFTQQVAKWKNFLMKLNIDRKCFKGKGNNWLFNEDGLRLASDFLRNWKTDVYKSIRRLEGKHEYIEEYRRIIYSTISNLTALKEYADKCGDVKISEHYPNERHVFASFWGGVYDNSSEEGYYLSGMKYIAPYFDLLEFDIREYIPDDLEYVAMEMQESFDELHLKFEQECDMLARKWFIYMQLVAMFRNKEKDGLFETLTQEDIDEIKRLNEESDLECKLDFAWSLERERIYTKVKGNYLKKCKEIHEGLVENVKNNERLRAVTEFESCEKLHDRVLGILAGDMN